MWGRGKTDNKTHQNTLSDYLYVIKLVVIINFLLYSYGFLSIFYNKCVIFILRKIFFRINNEQNYDRK